MKTTFLAVLSVILFERAYPQNKFVNTADGQPMHATRYKEVEGTPYWKDDFSKSEARSRQNGKWYAYSKARYNCYRNELEYEQSANRFMYLGHEQISEFKIDSTLFRCNFPAIGEWDNRHFYQVLYDGDTKLLKRIHSKIITETIFVNVTKSSKFEREEQYFLCKNGKMMRIKLRKSSLLDALSDKQDSLLQYVKSNNLGFSSEEDWKKMIRFYDNKL